MKLVRGMEIVKFLSWKIDFFIYFGPKIPFVQMLRMVKIDWFFHLFILLFFVSFRKIPSLYLSLTMMMWQYLSLVQTLNLFKIAFQMAFIF